MLVGTGANIWSFDLPGGMEIAGKTGTTNDNSDAWFMGYTPQLLAGGWVGCDDRFIRFNTESKNGEGGRAAMPIWAYFMGSAANDPNCGIDQKLTFAKPEGMNEINIDWKNGAAPILNGEEEGAATGTSDQYSPKTMTEEDLTPPESDIKIIPEKPSITPGKSADPKNGKNPGDKPAGTPATTPAVQKPKGAMPPPVKKPGGTN